MAFPGQVHVPPSGPAYHFDGAALKPLNPGTGRKNLLIALGAEQVNVDTATMNELKAMYPELPADA